MNDLFCLLVGVQVTFLVELGGSRKNLKRKIDELDNSASNRQAGQWIHVGILTLETFADCCEVIERLNDGKAARRTFDNAAAPRRAADACTLHLTAPRPINSDCASTNSEQRQFHLGVLQSEGDRFFR
jgi:hypothetical protein